MLKLYRELFAKPANIYYRNLVTAVPKRIKKVKSDAAFPPKIPKEIISHFDVPEKRFVLNSFPEKILQRNRKDPDGLYIASEETARIIANVLEKDLNPNKLIVEANPGTGLLTKHLLNKTENDILLYEPKEHFHRHLNNVIINHPERNITLRNVDLNSIWRIAHLDKIDHGTRVDEALKEIPKSDFNDDSNARLFYANGSLSFVKHLINSVIFQSSLMSFGRCELFLCLPPPLFVHLTCSNKASYMIYRSTSVLFQLLFEYEFICKINRKDLLPWQAEKKQKPYMKMGWFHKIDSDFLYMMRAVPRKDLYQYCLPENLPALWFFVRQHFISRRNRVIPSLERWIPNCGLRVTLNMKPASIPELHNPHLDITTLPNLVEPCRKLSHEDFVNNINIYTEFGDLRPTQVLTLFNQFINWPEYQECSFGPSLENVLHTNIEENVEELTEEDDAEKSKIS